MNKIIALVEQKIISLIIRYPSFSDSFKFLILYKFIVLINSFVLIPIPSKKAIIRRIILLVIFNFNKRKITNKIFR